MKSFKKHLIPGLFLMVTVFILMFLALRRFFSPGELYDALSGARLRWLIPGALAMLFFFTAEGMNIGRCLRIAKGGKKEGNAIRYALAGFFFSSLTPSSSGGQPMQLYLMHRKGISISKGSFALLLELLSFQLALLTLGGLSLLFLLAGKLHVNEALEKIFIVGFLLRIILVSCILLSMFSRSAGRAIAGIFTAIFVLPCFSGKVKLRMTKRVIAVISEYRHAAAKIKKAPKAVVPICLVSFIQAVAYFSIPFFACMALGQGTELGGFWSALRLWVLLLLRSDMLYVSASFFPLPGAAGAMEGGYLLAFSGLFPLKLSLTAVVLIRLINFAFPLAVSGLWLGAILLSERKKQIFL